MSTACEPYQPRGSALELLYTRAPEVLLSGPAGTGKSRACLEKLHLCALKYSGMRALICRNHRVDLSEAALVTFEEHVLPSGSRIALGPGRAYRRVYRYPNRSEIVVAGLSRPSPNRPSPVMSTEFDIAYLQEGIEASEADFEALTIRMRNGVMPYQQVLVDTNPWSPSHWLKQRCDRGQMLLLESRHEENPRLYDSDKQEWTEFGQTYITALDALTGLRKARLRYGHWVQAEGQVYDTWDRVVHVVSRLPPEAKQWRRIRSVDFGFTNPFVCGWFAVDPDGRMWLYREIYRSGRLVADHARDILRLSHGERVETTVCDHDSEDRATLEAAGIPTRKAFKNIRQGIEAVSDRLRPAADGRPRLFVVAGALVERDRALEQQARPWSTEQEFEAYAWPLGTDGRATREVPVDRDNHGMDMLRYAVVYVDGLGRKLIRAF
jgi:hypothetical protein